MGAEGGSHAVHDAPKDLVGGRHRDPNVTSTRSTELSARPKGDTSSLEEEIDRVVAQAKAPAVEPGEIATLRWHVANLRKELGQ